MVAEEWAAGVSSGRSAPRILEVLSFVDKLWRFTDGVGTGGRRAGSEVTLLWLTHPVAVGTIPKFIHIVD